MVVTGTGAVANECKRTGFWLEKVDAGQEFLREACWRLRVGERERAASQLGSFHFVDD
jgi:hypothetical protein